MTYHNIIIDDLLIKSTNLPHKIKFLNRHIYIN
jgi:hypothetical protein